MTNKVHCDAIGCTQIAKQPIESGMPDGWSYREGKDLCPVHTAKVTELFEASKKLVEEGLDILLGKEERAEHRKEMGTR